jgi:hypothetical protein
MASPSPMVITKYKKKKVKRRRRMKFAQEL